MSHSWTPTFGHFKAQSIARPVRLGHLLVAGGLAGDRLYRALAAPQARVPSLPNAGSFPPPLGTWRRRTLPLAFLAVHARISRREDHETSGGYLEENARA